MLRPRLNRGEREHKQFVEAAAWEAVSFSHAPLKATHTATRQHRSKKFPKFSLRGAAAKIMSRVIEQEMEAVSGASPPLTDISLFEARLRSRVSSFPGSVWAELQVFTDTVLGLLQWDTLSIKTPGGETPPRQLFCMLFANTSRKTGFLAQQLRCR